MTNSDDGLLRKLAGPEISLLKMLVKPAIETIGERTPDWARWTYVEQKVKRGLNKGTSSAQEIVTALPWLTINRPNAGRYGLMWSNDQRRALNIISDDLVGISFAGLVQLSLQDPDLEKASWQIWNLLKKISDLAYALEIHPDRIEETTWPVEDFAENLEGLAFSGKALGKMLAYEYEPFTRMAANDSWVFRSDAVGLDLIRRSNSPTVYIEEILREADKSGNPSAPLAAFRFQPPQYFEQPLSSTQRMLEEPNDSLVVTPVDTSDARKVFVVYGRDTPAKDALFGFLRSLDLQPMEWEHVVHLSGQGSPFIGQSIQRAFEEARAIVVLFTPDELAQLDPDLASEDGDTEQGWQARPNVIFEAGMAFGFHPDRTIIVHLGKTRPISDLAGRHVVYLSDSAQSRSALKQRLRTAGCKVDDSGADWLKAGSFRPRDVRAYVPSSSGPYLQADFSLEDERITLTNKGSEELVNLKVTIPAAPTVLGDGYEIGRLPAGASKRIPAEQSVGDPGGAADLIVEGMDAKGNPFRVPLYIDLDN